MSKKTNQWGVAFSVFLKFVIVALIVLSLVEFRLVWVFGCILGLLASLVPSILKRNYNITLPLALELLITIALLLHIGGGTLNAYHTIPYFDTITHFVSASVIALIAFIVIYILDEYWDGLMMDKYAMAFLVVIFTVSMGVVWEFCEWAIDFLFPPAPGFFGEQWGYDDTIKDLFVDMLAGIVITILGVMMIKRGSFDEMTDSLGKQINEKIIHKMEKK